MKRSIKTLLLALALVVTAGHANAQCVGVHISQSWDCENSTASATANPIGGTAPYTYNWSTGDTTQTAAGLIPGNYNITVIDAVGCLKVQACFVVQPQCCLWAYWTSEPASCITTGSATIYEIGGGVSPYTVQLPNGSVMMTNGMTPVFLNNLAAGNYTVTITDSKGCVLEVPLWVYQLGQPEATVVLAPITCGQTTTTGTVFVNNGSFPYTYLWDNGTTTASAVLNAGTHTVTVTDALGCTTTATTEVILPQPPVVNLTATNTTCGESNGTITTTTTGGTAPYAYLWSNGATTANLTNLPAGAYTLTVTGSNGCSAISFATVLPSTGAQDTVVCKVACDSVEIYGMVFYQNADTSFTENVNGCTRTVSIHAIVLTTGSTITQNITACYGSVVSVNGTDYTNDVIITVTGTGTCPGQVVWNLEFSAKPDTIQTQPIVVCGLTDTTFTFPVTIQGSTGCAQYVLLKSVQVQKVQQATAWLQPMEQCGLVAQIDTLYKGVVFNPATCTLTTTLQELVTNPIQQQVVWGPQQDTCGLTAQVHEILDSIQTNQEQCTQLVFKHKLVVSPLVTDTIIGQPEFRCGANNETFLVFDDEVVDLVNCTSLLYLHPFTTTAWETEVITLSTQTFCADTSVTLTNFVGRVSDTLNCRDTMFFENYVLVESTQDTTWSDPVVTCGFVTGVFVVTDSTQETGCHTQVFAKTVTVNPILVEEVIGTTVPHCGVSLDSVLVTDNTITDTINCIQTVYKHWEVTYPIMTSSITASFCANDSYTWVRNGLVYTEPGVYTDTTLTVEGCPDIATLFLTELPVAYHDTTVFVCPGGMYQYEGNSFGAGTEEEFHYVSQNGCDSIHLLKVVEIQNPATIQTPPNITLDLPTMSQGFIDSLVANIASGDTINLLGATITEELLKINDSLWLQQWLIVTPCDTLEKSRTITVRQPNVPTVVCEVLIQRQVNNIVNITVSDIGDPQDIRVEVFSSNGRFVEEGQLNQGFNTIDFNHLPAGGYYLHIYADVLVNGKRKAQILHDAEGNYSWCVVIN